MDDIHFHKDNFELKGHEKSQKVLFKVRKSESKKATLYLHSIKAILSDLKSYFIKKNISIRPNFLSKSVNVLVRILANWALCDLS